MEWQDLINDPSLNDLPFKIELNEKGKIEMSPATNRHGRMQGKVHSLIMQLCSMGELYLECSIQTSKGVKVADVAWASNEFFAKYGETTPLPVAPEICVEILSPSNTTNEMNEKIDLYLAKGAHEVWLCDENGTLSIHTHEGQIKVSRIVNDFPQNILEACPYETH